jgi:hypothetical protein
VLEKTNFEWLCSRRGEELRGHISQQRDKRSLVYEVAWRNLTFEKAK